MKIYFDADTNRKELSQEIDEERHIQFAEAVLKVAGECESELSITLVDDEEIQEMNKKYRGINKPTDVLSFSMREGETLGQETVLGDVVISIDTAKKQAVKMEHHVADEIDELIFHGIIHLLGGDHETDLEKWDNIQNDLQNGLQKLKISYIPKGLTSGDSYNQS